MSGVMNSTHLEASNSHAGVRMKFWGVCCDGGKAYKQVVDSRFHLTMAVLDPKSFDKNSLNKTVTLSVSQHEQKFLLCVLKHDRIPQVNLNLIFDKGDDVTFVVHGNGTVNLTGYQLIDSLSSSIDMDNQHYCPVAELASEKQKHRLSFPGIVPINKAVKKALEEDVGDEDEDDSDFSASAMEGMEESSSEGYDDPEDEEDEMLVSEIEALKQDLEDDDYTIPLDKGSQKRRLENISILEKRLKREPDEESDGDDQSDSDKVEMNSSIGNTPMPKKKDGSIKDKKKLKKKRLSEISNITKIEKENDDSSFEDKKPKVNSGKRKYPILRLEGGVECQDVTIGKGPVATNGKIVSIFYLGRLENKTIFDARTAPNKPYSFKLGVPEVIKGLDIGINGMRVGGQRKLKIPPKMGYGSKKMENIPVNSTLFFNIELISVN